MSYYAVFKSKNDEEKKAMREILKSNISHTIFPILNDMTLQCRVMLPIKQTLEEEIKDIYFNLLSIKLNVIKQEYIDAEQQLLKDGEIVYCGWEYSKDEYDYTEEEITKNTLSNLSTLKIVDTPDYFDQEELYYKKLTSVEEAIEYFKQSVAEYTRFEIMDKLKDYREKDEE